MTTELTTIQDNRLCEMEHDAMKALGLRFIDISKAIGIQEPPEDVVQIITFVKLFYPTLTIRDVSDAFLMNSAGQLITTVEPYYNSFDLTFIGKVLNSFNETMRLRRVSKPVSVVPVERQLQGTESPKDRRRGFYGGLLEILRRDKKVPESYPWGEIYTVLYEKGRVKWNSEADRFEYIEKVKARLTMEASLKRAAGRIFDYKSAIKEAEDDATIQYQCKRQFCIDYFTKLITKK